MVTRSAHQHLDHSRHTRQASGVVGGESSTVSKGGDVKQLPTYRFLYSSEVELALSEYTKTRRSKGLPMSAVSMKSKESYGYHTHPFSIKILKLPQLYTEMLFMKRNQSKSVDPPLEEVTLSPILLPEVSPHKHVSTNTNTAGTYLTEEPFLSSAASDASSEGTLASTKLPSFSTMSFMSGSSYTNSTVPRYMRKATNKKKDSQYSAYYNHGFNANRRNKRQLQRLPTDVHIPATRPTVRLHHSTPKVHVLPAATVTKPTIKVHQPNTPNTPNTPKR